MKGTHRVTVETDNIKYEFAIRRSITVIQGDSATGKTTLIDILNEYSNKGSGRGIRVQTDVPCYVYVGAEERWEYELNAIKGNIVFIDEDYRFIHTKEFADFIQGTDNYYVLITRKPLYYLPYSINEIYGIKTSGKYHFPEQVYHEFYPIFNDVYDNHKTSTALILVEDSKAGYEFYASIVGKNRCITSGGNSGIYSKLVELKSTEEILVIVDGAAFGAYIEKLSEYRRIRKHIALYFPESFEWMILKSDVAKIPDITTILAHPEKYIDNTEYFSWEQFFTALLIEKTKDDPQKRYNKEKLSEYYKGKNTEKILYVMPEEIRKMII